MNKTVLVIDGQYFFRRIQESSKYDFNDERHIALTVDALAQSFSKLLKYDFKNKIDHIVFARDSKSWRKNHNIVYNPTRLNELKTKNQIGYKANRIKDETINWANAYEAFDIFIELLNEENVNVKTVCIDGAEGDDVMYIMSLLCLKNNDYCVLYTSDQDADAFVNNNTIIFRPQRNSFSVNNYVANTVKTDRTREHDIYDIFNTNKHEKNKLLTILDSFAYECVNPNLIPLERTIQGVNKENIYSIIGWNTQSGNNARPSKAHILKTLHNCGYNEDTFVKKYIYDDKFINAFCKELINVTKKSNDTLQHIIEIFKSNSKLLTFSLTTLPEELANNILNNVIDYDKKTINNMFLEDYNNILGINTDNQLKFVTNNNVMDSLLNDFMK